MSNTDWLKWFTTPPTEKIEQILAALKKPISLAELSKQFGISERLMNATLEDLKDAGYLIDELDGLVRLSKVVRPQDNQYREVWRGEQTIRFAAIGDTHLCSKWQQLTYLHQFYDLLAQEGISTVYHAGDITEGVQMRKGHEYEVFALGGDDQEEYVIKNYPGRSGITTKFITGNHDHASIKHSGHDIGKRIADKRPDMVYLGTSNAKVFLTPNCTVELSHPLDGSQYALSYSIQKSIDAMSGGEKPNILLNGHHHKSLYVFYRNIHAFEVGTFCAQTPWMRGKRLSAHLGGWIITIHVDGEGTITRCQGEFIPFYKAIENDC